MGTYNPVSPTVYGTSYKRLKTTNVLHIPERTDYDLDTTDTSAQIRVVSGVLYYYYNTAWHSIGGVTLKKFGVAGQDDMATEARSFDTNNNSFTFRNGADAGVLDLRLQNLMENPLDYVLFIDPADNGKLYYGHLPESTGGGGGGRFGVAGEDNLATENRIFNAAQFIYSISNAGSIGIMADVTFESSAGLQGDGSYASLVYAKGGVDYDTISFQSSTTPRFYSVSPLGEMKSNFVTSRIRQGEFTIPLSIMANDEEFLATTDGIVNIGQVTKRFGVPDEDNIGNEDRWFVIQPDKYFGIEYSDDDRYHFWAIDSDGLTFWMEDTYVENYIQTADAEGLNFQSIGYGFIHEIDLHLAPADGGINIKSIKTDNYQGVKIDPYVTRFFGNTITGTTDNLLNLELKNLPSATKPKVLFYDLAAGGKVSYGDAPTGGGGSGTTNIYYVSPSGNDSNNGLSANTPWATVEKVNAATLLPGDTVLFEGGKTWTITSALACKGGAAGNRITYGSYGSERAILKGNAKGTVAAYRVSYVTIRDLVLIGINMPTTWGEDGIYIATGYDGTLPITDISIINVKIDNFAGMGIGLWSDTVASTISNVLIEKCEISGCMNGCLFSSPDTFSPTGTLHINPIVRNCKFFNNFGMFTYVDNWSGSGIAMLNASNGLIEECEAYNNGWRNGYSFGGPHGIWTAESVGTLIRNCESHHNGTIKPTNSVDGGGFDIDGGCQNCIIEYCYSHDNAGCGYGLLEYGSTRAAFTGNVIRYCISVNDSRLSSMGGISIWAAESGYTNNRIHNNLIIVESDTIVYGTAVAIEFVSGTYNTLNIVNNILIIDGSSINLTSGTVGGTWANNIIYAMNGASLNYTTGCTTANPLLVNLGREAPLVGAYAQKGVRGSLWNYQLKAISPAVNAGTSTISGYTFPGKDFWDLLAPIDARNIGPHELVP